jgi:hypothetical protein
MPTERLELSKLKLDPTIQPRARMNPEVVEEYAERMKKDSGATFPPVVVFQKGTGSYWVSDGFHRVVAARMAGLSLINCVVYGGNKRSAQLHAAGANSTHGLRRTTADKRRAVLTLLADKEWALWSNRQIAEKCRVSRRMVDKVRLEVEEAAAPKPQATPPAPIPPPRMDTPPEEEIVAPEPTSEPVEELQGDPVAIVDGQEAVERNAGELRECVEACWVRTQRFLMACKASERMKLAYRAHRPIDEGFQKVIGEIDFHLTPDGPCPFCDGVGCRKCDKGGWATKQLMSESPKMDPEDMNPQQLRVRAIMELYEKHGQGDDHPKPSLLAKWLKDWSDDDALLLAIDQLGEQGKLQAGPAYVGRCLQTALKNGKRLFAPQSKEQRRHGAEHIRRGLAQEDDPIHEA